MSLELHRARYQRAVEALRHAVDKASALLNNPNLQPRNLRIGLDKTEIELHVILSVLLSKGIVTDEEYLTALADATEAEVHTYEAFLSDKLGVEVKLL